MVSPGGQDGLKSLRLPFELTCEIRRPAIGLIALATDSTIEHEFRRLLPLDLVALYHSRIQNDSQIAPDSLAAMDARIADSTSVLVPGTPLDVVAYCCTSAAAVMGEEAIFQRIRAVRADVKCTSPVTAALAAFAALGVSRIALLTPYRNDVSQLVRACLSERGVEIPLMGYFDEQDDGVVARISGASIRSAALELGSHDRVDAVFISCTTLRAAGIASDIEAALNKPVTTSTHALAWHCLRLAGIGTPYPKFGRLYFHAAG
jgi:maleate isomerase